MRAHALRATLATKTGACPRSMARTLRAALALVCLLLGCEKTSVQPHIVWILADDLGWNEVGFLGGDRAETPHLDHLASVGAVFVDAYANAPNCAPSRASLLTGLYPPGHGVYTVGSPARGGGRRRILVPPPSRSTLPADAVTIADVLDGNGYQTAYVGKWHLGVDAGEGPQAYGFERVAGVSPVGKPRAYFPPYGIPDLDARADGAYLTDRLTTEAIRMIETRDPAVPLFLVVSHYAVHLPLAAPPALVKKVLGRGRLSRHEATYAAMIESLDSSVRDLEAALERSGIADETVVVFFSDNGAHGSVRSEGPFRGEKGMLYEGGIRVPLVIDGPGVEPQRPSAVVTGVDLFPTMLDYAGVPSADRPLLDGTSLMPLLEHGTDLGRDAVFWHFPAYLDDPARPGQWRTTPASAVRSGKWKLIEFHEGPRRELYDLEDDPGETADRSNTHPAIVDRLQRRLSRWRVTSDAPLPIARQGGARPTDSP